MIKFLAVKQCEHNEKELYEKLDSMRTEFLFLKGKFSGISEMKIQSVEKKDHQQELNLYGSVLSELKKYLNFIFINLICQQIITLIFT